MIFMYTNKHGDVVFLYDGPSLHAENLIAAFFPPQELREGVKIYRLNVLSYFSLATVKTRECCIKT